jgi:hypothetical protein
MTARARAAGHDERSPLRLGKALEHLLTEAAISHTHPTSEPMKHPEAPLPSACA